MSVVLATTVLISLPDFAQPQYQPIQPLQPLQPVLPYLPTFEPPGFLTTLSRFFSNLFGSSGSVDVNVDGLGGNVGFGAYPGGVGFGGNGQIGGFGAGVGGYNGVAPGGFIGGVQPVAYNPNGATGFFNTLFGNRPYGYGYGYPGNGIDDTQVHIDVNTGGYPYYGIIFGYFCDIYI